MRGYIPKLALIASLVGSAALAPALGSAGTHGPVRCELRAVAADGGILLQGIASTSRATSGSYSLVVSKSGDAGSADISQGGTFSVVPGATSTLGEVTVSLEKGAAYDAVLTLRWNGGSVSCSRTLI